ncbi:hypothetical protein BEWA_010750 [Theileria equi strain WA]|uniref:CPW-WPC domain-containing protein n=1 Tax=Theileria equi strain WA TaxID=1537102 RepID=L0B2D5_THEEQ|nr:hypothetical protein BEWA_010750 [Theileria equi strain WA]AFZ81658.1 hypothetical protein BEWA_010750 [Theileria equi strain WA]|eukprot:XP_004831324.1 hypothetical protein BEWA_010750 [Theileria equi strain WA]
MKLKKLTFHYYLYFLYSNAVHASSRDDTSLSQNNAAANISRDLTELSDNISELMENSGGNTKQSEAQGNTSSSKYEDIFTEEIKKEQAEANRQYDAFENESTKGLDLITYVTKELKVFWYTGQCKRNYGEKCPKDWNYKGENICSAPEGYNGQCNTVKDFSNLEIYEKKEFAWKCVAEWPCTSETLLEEDFQCPAEWVPIENNLCLAPQDYRGKCPPIMDFSRFNKSEKAELEQRCQVRWKRLEQLTKVGESLLYSIKMKLNGAIRDGIIYQI